MDDLIIDKIGSRYWWLGLRSGEEMSDRLLFKEEGRISGYLHPNERYWAVEDGCLKFFSKDREISAKFDEFNLDGDQFTIGGKSVWRGSDGPAFLLRSQPADFMPQRFRPTAHGLPGQSVGDHTYGSVEIIDPRPGGDDVQIGKFTSIGPSVKLISGNHNINLVSSYPFNSIGNRQWMVFDEVADHYWNDKTIIGNDVWIGHTVIIKGGVTIGDGAVVAAGSIVTKDVEPYSIVAGVPAKHIKYRFTKEQVDRLKTIKWWDWQDETINDNLAYILSGDIDAFIERFGSKNF